MQTIDRLIKETCHRNPDQVALRTKRQGRWVDTSYADLWQLVEQFSAGLEAYGFQAGAHAAIVAPATPRWVAAYLSILHCGGVAVPIDKELKASELRHILVDCRASILFTEVFFLDILQEIVLDLSDLETIVLMDEDAISDQDQGGLTGLLQEWHALAREETTEEGRSSRLEQLTGKIQQLLWKRDDRSASQEALEILAPGKIHLTDLLREGRLVPCQSFFSKQPAEPAAHSPEQTAVILYTSGTTGQSKGAMLSHANIVTNIRAGIEHFGLTGQISTLSFLPINHVFEQVCGILLPLSLGGTINFAESIKKLGENLADIRPTFLLGVPAVYRLLLDRILKNIQARTVSRILYHNPLTRGIVSSKVRKKVGIETKFISGGAPLDPGIAQGFQDLGLQLYQGYGITETSPIIAAESPTDRQPGSVGRPIRDVEVRIDRPNDEGVGEIWVRGPNIMQGYYRNPQATREVMTDGWYHTGDLGRIDEEGHLYICGRVKNLIVTANGKNVYPEEVENELLKSPLIAEVMVYGHQVAPHIEEVYAIIFPSQERLDEIQRERDEPLTQQQVEDLVRREVLEFGKKLADYKRIRKFTLREDEFPKTTTRKIKRYVVEPDISTAE